MNEETLQQVKETFEATSRHILEQEVNRFKMVMWKQALAYAMETYFIKDERIAELTEEALMTIKDQAEAMDAGGILQDAVSEFRNEYRELLESV